MKKIERPLNSKKFKLEKFKNISNKENFYKSKSSTFVVKNESINKMEAIIFNVKLIKLVLLLSALDFGKSQLAAEFIAKKIIIKKESKIEITDKVFKNCKDNPLIDLLPQYITKEIRDSLSNLPDSTQLPGCQTKNSCCRKETLDVFSSYLKEVVLKNKFQIFEKNSKIYEKIIKEHNRNFNAFQVKEEDFINIFSEYKDFSDKILNNNKSIIKQSLLFQWNSFCNYICSPDYKSYCKVYNETISVNEKQYWSLKYDCSVDSDSSNQLNLMIKNFEEIINNADNTLEIIYDHIKEKSKNIGNIQIETSFNVEEIPDLEDLNKERKTNVQIFINNSLKDGLHVSKSISEKKAICSRNSPDCETIKSKICIPFFCFDDLFLQYYDDSTIYHSETLEKSNYTIVNVLNQTSTNFKNFNKDSHIQNIYKEIENALLSKAISFYLFLVLVNLLN